MAPGHDARNEALNRTVKQMEWWQLLRSAFPLIAIGLGVGGLYLYFGTISARYWVGSGLALAGAVLASIGYTGRLREIRQPGDPTTRHYQLIFLAWVLVLAGAIIPPYTAR
jgi:hypothetical protein